MPVRARSRTSRSSKNASLSVWMARNASSSASKPLAMTPPSRTMAAGSAAIADCSSAAQAGGACKSWLMRSSKPSWPSRLWATRALLCKVFKRPSSSRGRTWRRLRRAAMRSTSALPLICARKVCPSACAPPSRWCSASMACKRARAWVRSRSGDSSQALSMRLPMPLMQVSSKENSVGASSPRRVWVSSKLRRVLAGRSMRSPSRCTSMALTCASARPWVCSA